MNNFLRSSALMTIFYYQQNPSAFHFISLFTLAPCALLLSLMMMCLWMFRGSPWYLIPRSARLSATLGSPASTLATTSLTFLSSQGSSSGSFQQ